MGSVLQERWRRCAGSGRRSLGVLEGTLILPPSRRTLRTPSAPSAAHDAVGRSAGCGAGGGSARTARGSLAVHGAGLERAQPWTSGLVRRTRGSAIGSLDESTPDVRGVPWLCL